MVPKELFMFEESTILEAIKHDLTEKYNNIRFECHSRTSLDVFFHSKWFGFSIFKHAFSLGIENAKIIVKPGTLLRLHIGQDIQFELIDPLSIDKLIGLTEECQKNWPETQ